jgi:uncharacterized repeat protein (TIGR01451 family)
MKRLSKRVEKIRGFLMIYGFIVLAVGLFVSTAFLIPQISGNSVNSSAAECPGEYRGDIPSGGVSNGGFWGHYKCENVFEFLAGGCQDGLQGYTATKPVFDQNFCGLQQIDYFLPSDGEDWFESCIITCDVPPPPPPGVECGNGVIEEGEQCDPPGGQCWNGQTCTNECTCPGTPPPPPPPPSGSACTETTTATVSVNGAGFTTSDVTINFGDEICIRPTPYPASSVHGTATVLMNPLGLVYRQCSTSSSITPDCGTNGVCLEVTPDLIGAGQRFQVRAWVFENSNPFIPVADDPACTDSLWVNVRPENGNPSYTIEKIITDADGFYNIGETVNFMVRVRNTGELTLTTVAFRDIYNPSRLDYLSSSANRNGGSAQSVNFSVNESTGVITHSDLTSVLGDLNPNDYYDIAFRFRALTAVNRTCNEAYVNPDNLGEITDDECLSIGVPLIEPPDL